MRFSAAVAVLHSVHSSVTTIRTPLLFAIMIQCISGSKQLDWLPWLSRGASCNPSAMTRISHRMKVLARTPKCILAGFSQSASTNHLISPVKWIDDWFSYLLCLWSLFLSTHWRGVSGVTCMRWLWIQPSKQMLRVDFLDKFQSISRLPPDVVSAPVKSALAFLECNYADLTPHIVRRESVVLSAPNCDFHHWLEASFDGKWSVWIGIWINCSRWFWPVKQMILWKVSWLKTLNWLLPFNRQVSRLLAV